MYIVLGIVGFFALLVVWSYFAQKSRAQKKTRLFQDYNFNMEKYVEFGNYCFAFDYQNKKLFVRTSLKSAKVFDFSEIESYALTDNDPAAIKFKHGAAIAGGLTYGVFGAAAGTARDKENCKSLQIVVKTKNQDEPAVRMELMINRMEGMPRTSPHYLEARKFGDLVLTHLDEVFKKAEE